METSQIIIALVSVAAAAIAHRLGIPNPLMPAPAPAPTPDPAPQPALPSLPAPQPAPAVSPLVELIKSLVAALMSSRIAGSPVSQEAQAALVVLRQVLDQAVPPKA